MNNEKILTLKHEMQDVVTRNILPFWMNKMQDLEHGGFYGQMTGEGQLVKAADKGCILNARILWSFSAAYRVLKQPEYLEAATRAKEYILEHFIDREQGGAFWALDYQGNPSNTRKQFYALGFVLYGLTEYVRATGDHDAFDEAVKIYRCIEKYSIDPVQGGYIEALSRDWKPLEDMRLSVLDANYPKSQNTHLHIIEPYTNLFRLLNERPQLLTSREDGKQLKADCEQSLRNLITIFTTRILNPETHHLDLFFEMDWTRGAGWIESYGHDIECSWLMHEAALVLGDSKVLAEVEPIVQLVAKASEKGLNLDGSMTHEANLDTGHVDDDRHWWVQAEAVVGFLNIYQHFADEDALQKGLNAWTYIKENLIDWESGEWYWSRNPQGEINRKDDHAGFWKCPYHNSRMCLEIIEREF
ncbi:MAG: AGE family epimerase/isomerase [Paludibacteraceae bacterium]|nr:AGE family epimerase/isomerase [Paludibacteraceae bacterium]